MKELAKLANTLMINKMNGPFVQYQKYLMRRKTTRLL